MPIFIEQSLTTPVAIIAGTLLPYLAARDRRLLRPTNEKNPSQIDEDDSDEEEDAEMDRIRGMVREWKAEAARHGRPLKLPTSEPLSYETTLTSSAVHAPQHLDSRTGPLWSSHGVDLFHHKGLAGESAGLGMTDNEATVAIALVGICWAIACWV